jgi:hypothetical protein
MAPENTSNDYSDFIQDIKNDIEARLRDLISNYLDKTESTLLEMAQDAPSNKEQIIRFEWLRLLRENKSNLATSYSNNITPLLRPFPVTEAEKKQHKLDAEDELSLVDHSEIEDMVLVKNIGERAAGNFREQISNLEARLEYLALKTDDIFQKRAISPINLCQAFDDALGDDFDIDFKKRLFGFFYENVASKFGTLYDAINDKLIGVGILPEIKIPMLNKSRNRRRAQQPHVDEPDLDTMDEDTGYDPRRPSYQQQPRSATTGSGSTGAGNTGGSGSSGNTGGSPGPGSGSASSGYAGASPGGEHAGTDSTVGGHVGSSGGGSGGSTPDSLTGNNEASDAEQSGNIGSGYAMTAAPGQLYHGGSSHAQNEDQATTQSPSSSSGQHGPAGSSQSENAAPASDTNQDTYTHSVAGMPAEQVNQTLGNFLGTGSHKPGADTSGENPSFPASTPQAFGHDEILSALSSVQSLPQFDQPSDLRFDAEAIKNAVINEIAKKSGGIVTKRINQLASKTIDFIELIFDAIIEDDAISDTIKALLLRLQIPIIKASMLDPEFFIYDTHPARVLLDKIAEVGFGVTDHEDEIYIKLDQIISIILNEYELQTSTFQHALDKLNEFIENQEALAREKEGEAQKQVLREHARNTVLKALRTITAGKTLPESIHPLVLKRWPTLMFNHYLTNGKDNDQWITIIEALREIVASVQPITTADELAYLQHHQDAILTRTRHFLKATNRSSHDIESVLDGLKFAHENLIAKAHFDAEETELANQRLIGNDAAAQEEDLPDISLAVTKEDTPPAPRLPTNITPGMWFHIYIGEDKAARRAKLSVIIMEDSKLVFVNHNGDIIVEKSFDEFIDEIEQGKSRMIMGHSVFDHALHSVIGQLRD